VDAGCTLLYENITSVEKTGEGLVLSSAKEQYLASAVIIAGGSVPRKLGVPGEAEFTGRGVSYCATCDGNFYRNKVVAGVGGGNTALEDALYLADLAEKVYLIHRRDSFRGEAATVARLQERDNVEFVYNSNVTRLIAETRLTAIEVTNSKDGSVRPIELRGLFVAVGRIPENQNFSSVVQLDESGYIVAGEDCHTTAPGIFAAGDNRVKLLRQLVTATADGAMAATEAIKYISEME
jgi:thioredoxin reductase (NADPH)